MARLLVRLAVTRRSNHNYSRTPLTAFATAPSEHALTTDSIKTYPRI